MAESIEEAVEALYQACQDNNERFAVARLSERYSRQIVIVDSWYHKHVVIPQDEAKGIVAAMVAAMDRE